MKNNYVKIREKDLFRIIDNQLYYEKCLNAMLEIKSAKMGECDLPSNEITAKLLKFLKLKRKDIKEARAEFLRSLE
jgi:hypothetical protein